LLPSQSHVIKSFVAPGKVFFPTQYHYRVMLSTAKSGVSWLVPTLTNPVLLFWQNIPYGAISPNSSIGKSWSSAFRGSS
jgi:hypothetical protein